MSTSSFVIATPVSVDHATADLETGKAPAPDAAKYPASRCADNDSPIKVYCCACDEVITTKVAKKGRNIGLMYIFSLGWICCNGCCKCCHILPFCWPVPRDYTHRCPNCGDVKDKHEGGVFDGIVEPKSKRRG